MSLVERCLVWIISFLIFLLLLFIGYKVSYKLGIKKALYRTTYILLCVVMAFVFAPWVNNELLSYDLSNFNITLCYKDKCFTTLIDYIEEVIVHSDFLNDMYKYFPSLKDLFMDFPQVILVPLVYVVLFFVFLIVWLPLYLYLSYKRKRRILYERKDNRSHRIWAGVLGSVQVIFVVSVLFAPLNGVSRIYQNSTNDTLKNKNGTLCDERKEFEKYRFYCDILEIYDSTVFANIGGNNSISDYTFNALTRISYEDEYTSMSEEATLIIKSGIILNNSGLLDSLSSDSSTIPASVLVKNNLTSEDIDIIAETLSSSKYSADVVEELGIVVVNTLNDMMKVVLQDYSFDIGLSLSGEELVKEIKIGLNALTVLGSSDLLDDLLRAKDRIEDFVENCPENRKNDRVVLSFLLDLANLLDLDQFEMFCEYLFESKIFSDVIPYILDYAFKSIGFNFLVVGGDVLDQFYNVMDFVKLLKKYQTPDILEFVQFLNDDEMILMGEILDYMVNSSDARGVILNLLNLIFGNMQYSPDDVISISDWNKEVYYIRDICVVAKKVRDGGSVSREDIAYFLSKRNESQSIKFFIDVLQLNLDYFISIIGSGE